MVELSVGDGMLKVEILGWHKVFAIKNRFLIPLEHVAVCAAIPRMRYDGGRAGDFSAPPFRESSGRDGFTRTAATFSGT